MPDEKQEPTADPLKQRAAEIAIACFGPMFTRSELHGIERALREGMAMRVPDAIPVPHDCDHGERVYRNGWNACRAAMLARNRRAVCDRRADKTSPRNGAYSCGVPQRRKCLGNQRNGS